MLVYQRVNMVLPKAKMHNLVDAQREPNIFLHHVAHLEVSILSCYSQIITAWWFQPTPLKNDGIRQWVSWDDDIPNWMESHKNPWFQSTTNQWLKKVVSSESFH